MRVSRTIVYAVYAILQLGKAPPGARISRNQLAITAQLPERFLLEVLHSLVAKGIVRSTRGVDGGFSLVRAPEEITLRQIFEAFDYPPTPYVPVVDGQSLAVDGRILEVIQRAREVALCELQKVTVSELLDCGRAEPNGAIREGTIPYTSEGSNSFPMGGENVFMSDGN